MVHACWHAPFVASSLAPSVSGPLSDSDLMVRVTDEPKQEADKDNATPSVFKVVEALTKGIEIPLRAGYNFATKMASAAPGTGALVGTGATTYRSAAMLSPRNGRHWRTYRSQRMRELNRSQADLLRHYWLAGTLFSIQQGCLH